MSSWTTANGEPSHSRAMNSGFAVVPTATTQPDDSNLPVHFMQPNIYGTTNTYGGFNLLGNNYGNINLPHDDFEARRQKYLDSLYYREMYARLNNIKPTQHKTFEWAFEQHQSDSALCKLAEWLRTGRGMFLVQGKAGSGKSTFMKFIFKHQRTPELLEDWANGGKVLLLFHSFWLVGSLIQRSFKGFVTSFIFQLLNIQPEYVRFCEGFGQRNHYRSIDDWDTEDLYQLLLHLLQSVQAKVCIFVDGLDEFDHDDEFERLWESLTTLVATDHKLCLSSRPINHILRHLKGIPGLKLHDVTATDIESYIRGTLRTKTTLIDDDSMKTYMIDHLTRMIREKADGVFLWVYYVLRNVCVGIRNGDDLQNLLARVDMLPSEILALYDHMWKLGNEDNATHIAETVKLFRLSKYFPLTLHQVVIAMTSERHNKWLSQPDEEEVHTLCERFTSRLSVRSAGLLECRDLEDDSTMSDDLMDTFALSSPGSESKEVGFFHRTVHEYLFGTEDGKTVMEHERGWTQFDAAFAIAKAQSICFMFGFTELSLIQIGRLFEYIQPDDPDLTLAGEIGPTLSRLARNEVLVNRHDNDDWVYALRILQWSRNIGDPVPLYVDIPGFIMRYLPSLSDMSRYWSRWSENWTSYYKGYLLVVIEQRFNNQQDSDQISHYQKLSWFANHGADVTTPHTHPTINSFFFTRSLILDMLADTFCSILQKGCDRKFASNALATLSFIAGFAATFKEHALTLVKEGYFYMPWDPSFDHKHLDGVACFVVFAAADVAIKLESILQQFLASGLEKTAERTLAPEFRNMMMRSFYIKQCSSEDTEFAIPTDNEYEYLETSPLDSLREFEEPLLVFNECENVSSDQVLERCYSGLIQDIYFMASELEMPCIPLDPYAEVDQVHWKKSCSMRHYFQKVEELEMQSRGSNSKPSVGKRKAQASSPISKLRRSARKRARPAR